MSFRIVIVGTGIAGLSAAIALSNKGHSVTVVEATAKLQAVGGFVVADANAARKLVDQFKYPRWGVHRADYQQILYAGAIERSVIVRLGCRVVSVDEKCPAIIINGGERIEADLVIGADGVNSIVRKAIVPESEIIVNYPESVILSDPESAPLMEACNVFLGPVGCIPMQPVRRGTRISVKFREPSDQTENRDTKILCADFLTPRESDSAPDGARRKDITKIREYFKPYKSAIQKLMSYVDEAVVWRLHNVTLESWMSKSGKGGAMALEDFLALAECLDHASNADAIPEILQKFQGIKKPRCDFVRDHGINVSHLWTLQDGPQQQERDRMFNHMMGFGAQLCKSEEVTGAKGADATGFSSAGL
ncbi:FAD/NAD(P)-binding domain-containing protein [Acephala macrosclerotiorum]|nr:FAD/NAD(P)-binding domain-containing protein [Acephala macrosclerotiorum]